jgi:hypothetical protein
MARTLDLFSVANDKFQLAKTDEASVNPDITFFSQPLLI